MEASSTANQNIRYLIASDHDAQWGLTVRSIGFQKISPNDTYPPLHHTKAYLFTPNKGRVLDEYQLIYITQGGG